MPVPHQHMVLVGHYHRVVAVGQTLELVVSVRTGLRRGYHIPLWIEQHDSHPFVAVGLITIERPIGIRIVPHRPTDGIGRIGLVSKVLAGIDPVVGSVRVGRQIHRRLVGGSAIRIHRIAHSHRQRRRIHPHRVCSRRVQTAEVVVSVLVGRSGVDNHAHVVEQLDHHSLQSFSGIRRGVSVGVEEHRVANQSITWRMPVGHVAEVLIQVIGSGKRQARLLVASSVRVPQRLQLSQYVA